MKNERRTAQGYRLRMYLELIKEAEAMTDAQWLENWIKSDMPWRSRKDWIAQLERWALNEASNFILAA